jgi:hypothetical protein
VRANLEVTLGFVEDAESSEVETLQVEILCDEVGG